MFDLLNTIAAQL